MTNTRYLRMVELQLIQMDFILSDEEKSELEFLQKIFDATIKEQTEEK